MNTHSNYVLGLAPLVLISAVACGGTNQQDAEAPTGAQQSAAMSERPSDEPGMNESDVGQTDTESSVTMAPAAGTSDTRSSFAEGGTSTSSSSAAEQYADAEPIRVMNGQATFYAEFFEGKKTASGAIYHHDEMTAASQNLPMGSVVRVVRPDTQQSVIVEINDRINENKASEIDVSRSAAKKLNMMKEGIIPVRIEVLHMPKEE